ncbi:MAG TPA: NUDIX domain-containing protein [Bacteroidales bacterium]|nr:NUDIX domain-containing protein [Bacteroidales bacterium]
MESKKFVIRVYAIIINDDKEVLLSDEYIKNTYMTKFPGGGLEWGEGTVDCLKREAMEEFGQRIDIVSHFYTTDYFQKALFFEETQLLSIYYRAKFPDPIRFTISTKSFDFPNIQNGNQSFRWKSLSSLTAEDFSFPIDQKVALMLKELA